MGKGGKDVNSCETDKTIEWDELRQHANRKDQWIVIEDDVYDITSWAKRHPGGASIISHWGGQDATVSFTTIF